MGIDNVHQFHIYESRFPQPKEIGDLKLDLSCALAQVWKLMTSGNPGQQ